MEIPFDLINQLQISLRRNANLPSYDPNDSSLTDDLPSAEQAGAALDPSPPYLRCRHCKGRLLRGLQSLICVFCGGEAFGDVVPEPINFRNTVGYKWLLDSLDLDGSEIVEASTESNNNKSKRRNATNDEFPLSEILDLEIKWPSESDRFGSLRSKEDKPFDETKASIDLSGVNIENYFSETALVNQTYSKESATEANTDLSLFDNAQSFETRDENKGSSSGWGASFPDDPFVGSAAPSAQTNRDVESTASDWFSHESFPSSNGPPPQGSKAASKEDDDSFDDWNEFATSAVTAQEPSDSIERTTEPFNDQNFSGRDLFPAVEASSLDRGSDDVKTILSQMNNLTFMLDNHLSIPPKQETSNSSSRD